MKRGTPYHKKMHRLATALDVPLPMAVGIMEMLWHHAAQHAPEGDIGSLPDVAIATAVFWPHDHETLINGLVSSNWLERHDLYRLIIHDWPDHCEQSVKKWLDRNHKTFLPVYGQSISVGYPVDIQVTDAVPPSREARARARAKAEEVISSEEEKVSLISSETRQNAPQVIRGIVTLATMPSERTTRAEQGKKPDHLRAAGFDSPEDFTTWWEKIVAGHPNRSKNAVARARIMEQILAGTFQRIPFTEGYTWMRANSPRWFEDRGRFAPNLYEIVEGELWKYEPVPLKKTDQERGLAG